MVVKTVEMTTKDFEYHRNFVDKVVAVYERMDSSFESTSVGNAINWHLIMLSNNAIEKSFMKGRVNLCGKHYCCLILRPFQSPPPFLLPTFSSHYPAPSAAISTEATLSTREKIVTCWSLRWWLTFLAINCFLVKVYTLLFFRYSVSAQLMDYSIM